MNIISYRGCPLYVLRSNPWVREVILDESQQSYKWTKWTISAIVTYNPAAISFAPLDAAGGQPGAGLGRNRRSAPDVPAGSGMPDTDPTVPRIGGIARNGGGPQRMPADTDVAIRRFLEFPRGQLIIYSTDMLTGRPTSLVLCSPAENADGSFMPCDANNGPFCKVNSIQEIAGERLWQIHLTFETYIREDSLSAIQEPPVLVSNQWSVAVDTNWQHLTTRIIEGMVHFRADQMLTTTASSPAEQFRSIFAAFTVPSGFQRKRVLCRTLASGNQVAYRIVDSEEPMQKTTPQSVRLEYVESSWAWKIGAGQAAAQAINAVRAGGAFQAMSEINSRMLEMAFASLMARTPTISLDQIGKRYKTVIVRAWGNREMSRANLTILAMSLAINRMATTALFDITTQEMKIDYHSAQMMAQIQVTNQWSFSERGGLGNVQNLLGGVNVILDPQGDGDKQLVNFAGQTENDVQIQRAPNRAQTTLPHDGGTRGSWWTGNDSLFFSRLTTQVLESIGAQDPGAPP